MFIPLYGQEEIDSYLLENKVSFHGLSLLLAGWKVVVVARTDLFTFVDLL